MAVPVAYWLSRGLVGLTPILLKNIDAVESCSLSGRLEAAIDRDIELSRRPVPRVEESIGQEKSIFDVQVEESK